MNIPKHRQAFLYLCLAVVGMILLGVSLPGMRLQAGLPIPGAESVFSATPAVQSESSTGSLPWLFQLGLAIGILPLLIALVIALLKQAHIKRTGLLAAALALLFVLFSQLPNLVPAEFETAPVDPEIGPLPLFQFMVATIGEPPSGLLFWVAAGLLLAGLVLIGWLLAHAFRRVQKDPLAIEAEAAVQAIAEGQSLRDVIIHCYLRMEIVIAREQGIERGRSVTPREFETYLVEKGIPRSPILQLTNLFERARYGNHSLNDQDKQEALRCFLAIQKTCQPYPRGIQ